MNVLTMRTMYAVISLLFFLVLLNGCAQQKFNVVDAEQFNKADVATIQSLKVSDDASHLEIVTDRDVVYSFYQTVDPPKVVVDLSQADPGAFTTPMEVDKGNIKRIEVAKRGSLSRIEIFLNKDGKFALNADPANKRRLLALFGELQKPVEAGVAVPSTGAAQEKAKQVESVKTEEVKPVLVAGADVAVDNTPLAPVVATPVKTEESAAVAAVSEKPVEQVAESAAPQSVIAPYKKVVSLKVAAEGVEIKVDGGVDKTNSFVLTKPTRLVVDLFGVKNGIKETSVPVDRFGLSKARFGVSADKVRIVFDSTDSKIQPYKVVKTDAGVSLLFGAAATAVPDRVVNTSQNETMASTGAQGSTNPAAAEVAGGTTSMQSPAVSPTAITEKTKADSSLETDREVKPSAAAASPDKVEQKVLTAIKAVDDGIAIVAGGGVEKFNTFRMSKPDRLVIDLFGVRNGMKAQAVAIGSFGVENARIGASADKVRIVLDVAKGGIDGYQVVKAEQGLKIVFTKEAVPATTSDNKAQAQATSPESAPRGKATAKSTEASLEAIDFSVIDDYSRIALKVTGACSPEKPVKGKNGLTLTVKGCTLPKKLQRMLDTASFPSVVREVTPYSVKRKGGYNTKIFVKLRADAPSTLKQEGDTIFWDIKNTEVPEPKAIVSKKITAQQTVAAPSRVEESDVLTRLEDIPQVKIMSPEQAFRTKKIFTGRKVTLEFSDADIRKIFQLIAEVSNLNFLIADDVSGTISIKLVNVPWDQALDVILESKNLEMKREGTIVQIKPKGKFKSMEQAEAEEKKARERQMDLQTVVFEINYAAVGEIAGQLDKLRSQHDNVSVSTDARTNRVIVTDIAPSIAKMRELIKTLDVPEKQVLIEARIVEASATFAQDLGVQWGIKYVDASASFAGINNLATTFGGVVATALPTATAGGIATGMSFGKLTNNVQIDLRLSAAASAGNVKIISTPKVVTLNNKAAKISQGQSIPYQTVSAEGTKTEFVEAALTLEVTPHITADGNIGMKIKASNNSPGSAPAGSTPPINKKEATTELQVRNGETTVIGGIYVDNDVESDTGVPFLKDIPLLGWLFKSNSKTKSKSELLIFITPKILS